MSLRMRIWTNYWLGIVICQFKIQHLLLIMVSLSIFWRMNWKSRIAIIWHGVEVVLAASKEMCLVTTRGNKGSDRMILIPDSW